MLPITEIKRPEGEVGPSSHLYCHDQECLKQYLHATYVIIMWYLIMYVEKLASNCTEDWSQKFPESYSSLHLLFEQDDVTSYVNVIE
jgi:hypothetical protein